MGTEDGAKPPRSGSAGRRVHALAPANASPDAPSSHASASHAARHASFVPTLARAVRLARRYYDGPERRRARFLLLVMLGLCACTTGLSVVFSYVQRDMSTALSEKRVDAFYAAIRRYLLVIVIAAPLFAMYSYVQSLVALEWRLWLTRELLRKYFANRAYFALKSEGKHADNPDQRICDDARNFVESCTAVLLAVVQKVLSMAAFFGVLWGISPRLVAFCFGYAAFGTVVTAKVFGDRLMALSFEALRREADLRFALVRVREHAESIALYRGARRELSACWTRLGAVAATLTRKIAWSRNLALFTNAYEFATFALPSLIIAPRYFAGEVEFGVVTQAGYAFRTVQSALNIIVGRFEQLSGLAAETERLEKLAELLDALEEEETFLKRRRKGNGDPAASNAAFFALVRCASACAEPSFLRCVCDAYARCRGSRARGAAQRAHELGDADESPPRNELLRRRALELVARVLADWPSRVLTDENADCLPCAAMWIMKQPWKNTGFSLSISWP